MTQVNFYQIYAVINLDLNLVFTAKIVYWIESFDNYTEFRIQKSEAGWAKVVSCHAKH